MGVLVIIEGMDGAGTTTQTKMLAEYLTSIGYKVAKSAEPTSSMLGQEIRKWLKEPLEDKEYLLAMLALCFAADRMHHVHFGLAPQLKNYDFVLVDRYVMSSMVYQGLHLPESFVAQINQFALKPDLTLLLDLEPEQAFKRIALRPGAKDFYESLPLLKKIREAYRACAKREPENTLIVDASMPSTSVHAYIKKIIASRFLGNEHEKRRS